MRALDSRTTSSEADDLTVLVIKRHAQLAV
jgi:hypothetical protein